jgi:hypothetical protein
MLPKIPDNKRIPVTVVVYNIALGLILTHQM